MQNEILISPHFLDKPLPQLEALAEPGASLVKPQPGEGDTQHRILPMLEAIAAHTTRALEHGRRPVSIAGDCCSAIGVAAGLERAGQSPVLVWLDAHGDFNTWETTPSGFLGGMPLAMLVGRGEQTLLRGLGIQPLSQDRVILCDARDLDPAERVALEHSGVSRLFHLSTLREHPLMSRPIWIHFDVDIVNPDDAPAMSYRATGGPSAAQVRSLFRALSQEANVVAVSMSTWNPELDRDGMTQNVCMDLLTTLIGH